MIMSTISLVNMIMIIAALFYLLLIPIFYFILSEKSKLINMIIISRNPRRRNELSQYQIDAKKDIILSLLWPLLLIRKVKNDSNNKK